MAQGSLLLDGRRVNEGRSFEMQKLFKEPKVLVVQEKRFAAYGKLSRPRQESYVKRLRGTQAPAIITFNLEQDE